jgi:hypothetical protein
MLVCVFLSTLARETAGAARTRSSLRPLSSGANEFAKLGRCVSRDRGGLPGYLKARSASKMGRGITSIVRPSKRPLRTIRRTATSRRWPTAGLQSRAGGVHCRPRGGARPRLSLREQAGRHVASGRLRAGPSPQLLKPPHRASHRPCGRPWSYSTLTRMVPAIAFRSASNSSPSPPTTSVSSTT